MSKSRPPLISNPMRPTVDWFNDMFETKGARAKIRSFDAEEIGTGQIGTNVRFAFNYEINEDNLPQTLVGKFPSENEQSRTTGKLLGHYEREVFFYETFPEVAGRIAPIKFYTDYDGDTDNFALIMEDMAPARQGDQIKGCRLAAAEAVMDSAAILHASHWNDPSIETHPWLQESKAAPEPAIGLDLVAGLWGGFKERYRDHISVLETTIGDAFAEALQKWSDNYTGPRCLTHADFRLDNMLFGQPEDPKPVAIVDWQTVGVRGPAIDVSYFIGAGLTREDRPKHERQLLERYHAALLREGVSDYSADQLWNDYRLYSFYGISVAFGAAMLVEQTERGDQMFLTMLRRHCAQVDDLDALSLL